MKLFYTPGACSQAPHILLHEIGLHHDVAKVDLRAKTLEDGSDYLAVNPKGAVPALELDSGEVLTENAVILQYLGDRTSWPEVLPPMGDFRRYRVLETVNFIATELHKGISPLFNPALTDEARQGIRDQIGKKFAVVEQQLDGREFIAGDELSIADPYLFVMTGWAAMHSIDLSPWPNLSAFRDRMTERPAVQQVLRTEGLLQPESAH